jgi:hypothetical protein
VERNGNEIRVTTTQKYGSDYCKDATKYINPVPKVNTKDEYVTFDVLFRTNSSVHLQANDSGFVFYQEGDKFLFHSPVLVIYNK